MTKLPTFPQMLNRSHEHVKFLRLIAEGRTVVGSADPVWMVRGASTILRTLLRWGLTETRREGISTYTTHLTTRGKSFLAWVDEQKNASQAE